MSIQHLITYSGIDKYNNVIKYSNPSVVLKQAVKYHYNPKDIYISTRQNKKYMIYNPYSDKFIHFGQMPYKDYTITKDRYKRENFMTRNHKWKDYPKYTPAHLAYYLLW
jgi:hypothetical protein